MNDSSSLGRSRIDPEALFLGIGFDQRDLAFLAAGQAQVIERLVIDPEEAAMALRDEQRRRQEQDKRRREADGDPEAYLAIPGDELNADHTVPVAPLMDEQPRQGLWVDIEV